MRNSNHEELRQNVVGRHCWPKCTKRIIKNVKLLYNFTTYTQNKTKLWWIPTISQWYNIAKEFWGLASAHSIFGLYWRILMKLLKMVFLNASMKNWKQFCSGDALILHTLPFTGILPFLKDIAALFQDDSIKTEMGKESMK